MDRQRVHYGFTHGQWIRQEPGSHLEGMQASRNVCVLRVNGQTPFKDHRILLVVTVLSLLDFVPSLNEMLRDVENSGPRESHVNLRFVRTREVRETGPYAHHAMACEGLREPRGYCRQS